VLADANLYPQIPPTHADVGVGNVQASTVPAVCWCGENWTSSLHASYEPAWTAQALRRSGELFRISSKYAQWFSLETALQFRKNRRGADKIHEMP